MRSLLTTSLALVAFTVALSPKPAHAQSRAQRMLEGALSGTVRAAVLNSINGMQAEYSQSWGHQARVWTGETKVVFQGLKSRLERIYRNKNDGEWKRGWVRLENPRNEFDLQIRNFRKTPGRKEIRFQIYCRAYFRAGGEFRKYKAGVQLIRVSGEARARAHITIDMRVYVFDNGRRIGWEATNADFKYSDFVADRIGHIRGYAARVMGDFLKGVVTQWFPQKERDAISRVKNAVSSAFRGSTRVRREVTQVINSLR